jgi:hypothetical protein
VLPLRSVPALRSFMTFSTFVCEPLLYLLAIAALSAPSET